MITPAEIQAKFPGSFDSLSDATIQLYIDEAANFISEDIWGDDYNLGLYYLTAHLLSSLVPASGGGAGAAGPVSSRRVGDLSVSFAVAASATTTASFAQTSYGQMFMTYLRLNQGGPLCVKPEGAPTS
jgi:hypothetical protein